MKLEELEVYQLSMDVGERVWRVVAAWDFFAKDTLGRQLVKAADSIAANLSEGFGRFFYKENKQFGYYARGSLFEARTWLTKAHNRELITDADHTALMTDLNTMAIRLNNYIRSIGPGPSAVRDGTAEHVAWENLALSDSDMNDAARPPMTNDGAAAPHDAPQAQLTARQRPMTRRRRN